MRGHSAWPIVVLLAAMNMGATPERAPEAEPGEAAVRRAGARYRPSLDAYSALTADKLMASLAELTSIGAHDGWRHSTSRGEAAAIDFMRSRLAGMGYLRSLGMEVVGESFRTYMGVRFHRSRVHFLIDGEEHEVPADAIPGHRESLELAMRFDSDGELNDTEPDPKIAAGPPVVLRTWPDLQFASAAEIRGRVVLLDYAAIDRVLNDGNLVVQAATRLVEMQPAGIVMITTFSNQRGLSHGSFAGDLSAFTWVEADPMPPILLVRFEDMVEIGVNGW